MGIYDRPYLRDEERSSGWSSGRSMVVNLIIINAAIWLAGAIFKQQQLNQWMALDSDLLRKPWQCWQLVTYGFAHADIWHILFNMFFLWLFGSELEGIYGRAEFLRIYLVAIVFAGLIWVLVTMATSEQVRPMIGASGGVMALMILYVLHFPRRMFYIWGVVPMPAWALGTMYVLFDVLGFVHSAGGQEPGGGPQVANIAHLGGALFGFIYFRSKMNLGRFVPRRLADLKAPIFRPKLRIHDPDKEARDLGRQVDAILEKISREGESSLTKKERKTLEEASRRYQQRRQ
jgi:membrane associated rhomboid family serine protease